MGFDIKKFTEQPYTNRTKEITIDGLKSFFSKGEKPIFTVRGLEGAELAEVYDAVRKNQNIEKLISHLASVKASDKLEAVKKALGTAGEVPDDIVKRMEMLVRGSVKPKLTLEAVLKLCETSPVEFYELTNAITELTGLGKVPGKPKPSGKQRKSATR